MNSLDKAEEGGGNTTIREKEKQYSMKTENYFISKRL